MFRRLGGLDCEASFAMSERFWTRRFGLRETWLWGQWARAQTTEELQGFVTPA